MTTVAELAQLVKLMRDAQKDYFEQRTRTALQVAKNLEGKVDRVILQLLGEQWVAAQGALGLKYDDRDGTLS